MSMLKLFSFKDNDFFEINKYIKSHDLPESNQLNLLKIAIKNSDIKLFKEQFNLLKLNYSKDGLLKMAEQVEPHYTYLNDLQMAQVLLQAYKNVYGQTPNVQLLGLLWSQAAFETGKHNGKFRLRNNNFGGVTAGNFDRKWNGSGWVESGKPYVVSDKSKMKFKAYPTPVAGAEEYIKTLGNLYPKSLEWKASGLIVDDVLYMATKNYFGQEKVNAYGGGMDTYMQQFMRNVYPSLKGQLPTGPKPPPGQVALKYKEYGDNAYLKNKENPVIDRKVMKSEEWAYPYKKEQAGQDVFTEEEKSFENDYQSLMKTLFACGPVEKLVKKAILKEKLGTKTLLIKLESNVPRYVQTRFARILGSALREELDAEISIYNAPQLEIECETYGSEEAVKESINEVFNYINNKLKKLGSFNINISDNKSEFEILNEKEESYRQFVFYALRDKKANNEKNFYDALDHVSQTIDRDLNLNDFIKKKEILNINDLYDFDDVSAWLEWEFNELNNDEDLINFRGKDWADKALKWNINNIDPIIIVITKEGYTFIGDGRGRVSYAIGKGWDKIPVIFLMENK